MLRGLGQAIITNAPLLASAAAKAITQLGDYLSANMPQIAAKGGELIGNLIKGIITHIPDIVGATVKIGAFLVSNLAKIASTMIRSGLAVIKGVASGITSGIGSAVGSAVGLAVGLAVGSAVGPAVGPGVGSAVGSGVGVAGASPYTVTVFCQILMVPLLS